MVQRSKQIWKTLRQPTVLPLVLSVPVGVGVGTALAFLADVQGKPRIVVLTTLTCLILAIVVAFFQRRAADLILTEVKINVPEFSELKFVINSEYRRVAWRLFIETMTRVATQPLPSQSGIAREALNSLHSLFSTCRELLKGMEPSKATSGATVELFAMQMLNHEIRPFLAKWHPLLTEYEKRIPSGNEGPWDRENDCRAEMEAVRQRLVPYARAFGELAGVQQLESFFSPTPTIGPGNG